MDLHGSMEYTFAENIEHFDSVHQTATLVADMNLREQRAVSSPQLQSSMNSPTMSHFHNESFQSSQTSESLRSRATASSVSLPSSYSRFLDMFLHLLLERPSFQHCECKEAHTYY